MSRRRWIVLLGPPLLIALAIAPGLTWGSALRSGASASLPARSITPCPSAPAGAQGGLAAAIPGTWWRTEPSLDAAGSLVTWTLLVGAPGTRTAELVLPAASTVTGPAAGQIVVASEADAGEGGSTVRIVDAAVGCAVEIRIPERIARRAVAHPDGAGVLVHMLEPGTRSDLGTWRIAFDGRIAERVLEPVPDALLATAGIDRVWATDLRLDPAGGRLAVQSCHPDACVTRIADLATGEVEVIARAGQGPIVGFSDDALVTWAACHGFPCPVVAWDGPGRSGRPLVADASGAALSGNGRTLVVSRPGATDVLELTGIDVRSGARRSIGAAGRDDVPLSGAAGETAGLEVEGKAVALGRIGQVPTARAIDATAGSILPDSEVQP